REVSRERFDVVALARERQRVEVVEIGRVGKDVLGWIHLRDELRLVDRVEKTEASAERGDGQLRDRGQQRQANQRDVLDELRHVNAGFLGDPIEEFVEGLAAL